MKQGTRIFIYILIGIAAVIMGSIGIIGSFKEEAPSEQGHIDLGRVYLNELSYEAAVMVFSEAIEIEPLNPEGYLGLAEAYIGMGYTDKAVEALESGYDKTGDERLRDMLEGLLPESEETVTTVTTALTTSVTTEETTTVSTVEMAVIPELSGLSEEEAVAACEEAGVLYKVSYGYSDNVEKGRVTGQAIPAGANVAKGVSLSFTVSEGRKPVKTTVTTTVETTVTTAAPVEFITIKGVQYPTSLTELDLSSMELNDDDIKDLDKMVNLTSLCLYDNQISDISALNNLTNLSYLYLGNNQISDISALSNLTNLTYLYLGDNQISDISALSNLTNLTELNLNSNQISDISALSNLTNLSYLILAVNQISDISALNNLTNLTRLHLHGNQISDISALNNLANLSDVFLGDNQISESDIEDMEKALPNCHIVYS